VIDQLRADNKEVEAFYEAQQLTRGGVKDHIGSIFSSNSNVGQTAARLNKILAAYPTSAKLYRTVISNALDSNETLCSSIASTVRNAIPPNQRLRLADQLETVSATNAASQLSPVSGQYEAIGNHHQHQGKQYETHQSGERDDFERGPRGHHSGNHRHSPAEHYASHSSHAHGSDGHHTGAHRAGSHSYHERYDVDQGYDNRGHSHPSLRHTEYTQAAYPRHEAHLTSEEATQAQIRSYVASGLIPPRFETFAEAEAKVSAKVAAPVQTPAKVGTRVAAPVSASASKTSPNVTREAPSLEPPRAGVSEVRIRPVANSFPVAVGSAVIPASQVDPKKQAVFARNPPPLETSVKSTAAPVSRGLRSVEVPSTAPIAVQSQRRTGDGGGGGSSPSVTVASSLWNNEMPSTEVVASVPVKSAVSPKTSTAAPIRSKPPPIEYVKKTSPSPVTPPVAKQTEASSLPSLAQMLKTAAESSRVH